jgi:hypothetical protein
MNRGYNQVVRSLKALVRYPALKPDEIRRFEQLAREAYVVTNTHLRDVLSAVEWKRADHCFNSTGGGSRKTKKG